MKKKGLVIALGLGLFLGSGTVLATTLSSDQPSPFHEPDTFSQRHHRGDRNRQPDEQQQSNRPMHENDRTPRHRCH